jgi:hypothetical protein
MFPKVSVVDFADLRSVVKTRKKKCVDIETCRLESQIVPQTVNYFEWLTIWGLKPGTTTGGAGNNDDDDGDVSNQFSFDSDGMQSLAL